jgi:spermidine synthase
MWTHIDCAWSEGNRLDLYERNGLYMIRVDGWELMNGEYHASEDQLGRLAGTLSSALHLEIPLGGLGLGYTLASLRETLTLTRAKITVAERSSAVLRWFGTHINPVLAATLSSAVRLVESDVLAHLGVDRRWDVIVLDVDNGPEALSTTGNAVLYEAHGLARCRDSLAPSGHLLFWTGFEDLAFVERARSVGSVTRKSIPLPNRPNQVHVLFVLSRQPLPPADRDRLDLGPEPGQPNRKERIGRRIKTQRRNQGIGVLRPL